jgi:hypothetical protein
MCGVIDVELVDLVDRGSTHPDCDGTCLDQWGKPFALSGRQGLRVPDARDPVAVRTHDDGRCDDGSTGWRDPDLVDADHPDVSLAPESALETESRDDGSHRSVG